MTTDRQDKKGRKMAGRAVHRQVAAEIRAKIKVFKAVDALMSAGFRKWTMRDTTTVEGARVRGRRSVVDVFRRVDFQLVLRDGESPGFFFFHDPFVVWPIDVSFASPRSGLSAEDEGIVLYRVNSVSTKEARALGANIFSQRMIRLRCIGGDVNKGTAETGGFDQVFSWIGGKWIEARKFGLWWGDDERPLYHKGGGANAEQLDQIYRVIGVSFGMALTHRYQWAVAVQTSNEFVSFRLPTDATGIKAIFKSRDAGESGRRSALRSWICDHWRRTRVDSDAETYVRQHMRGALLFEWAGMSCEVIPSEFDMDESKKIEAARAQMRLNGSDKRAVGLK